MSTQPPPRRRKHSRLAPGLDATQFPARPNNPPFEWTTEINLTTFDSLKLRLRRLTANFFPTTHPLLLPLTLLLTLLLLFPPTLRPYPLTPHTTYLHTPTILSTTWLLSESAQTHTSAHPSLLDTVLLQFPQLNGTSSIELRNVTFDPRAHYGVISMAKLEEDDVPMRTLFGVGGGRRRTVVGVEVIGRDIVAVAWGGGGQGTYMLKAWTVNRCEVGGLFGFWPWRAYCAVVGLGKGDAGGDIPAETMRELVGKHWFGLGAVDEDEDEREELTPWRRRALDQEGDVAVKEKEKKKKKAQEGLWGRLMRWIKIAR